MTQNLFVDEDIDFSPKNNKKFIFLTIILIIIIIIITTTFFLLNNTQNNNGLITDDNTINDYNTTNNNIIINNELGNNDTNKILVEKYCKDINQINLSQTIAVATNYPHILAPISNRNETTNFFIIVTNQKINEFWRNDINNSTEKLNELIQVLKGKGVLNIVLSNPSERMTNALKEGGINCFDSNDKGINIFTDQKKVLEADCLQLLPEEISNSKLAIPAQSLNLDEKVSLNEYNPNYFLIYENGLFKEAIQLTDSLTYLEIVELLKEKEINGFVTASNQNTIFKNELAKSSIMCYIETRKISEIFQTN